MAFRTCPVEPKQYETVETNAPTKWAHQTVLVTGCTGFLGCWVSLGLCQAGARVIGLTRQQPTSRSAFQLFGLNGRVTLVSGSIERKETLVQTMTHYTP